MELERLRLGRTAWATFEQGVSKEWLETNGLGGWAFGTVPGVNTRFYHAILAPSLRPPTERLVLVAKLDESLLVDGVRHDLYGNRWADGTVESDSLKHLQTFALSPFPTWTYMVGDVTVQKRLFMRHGSNTTVIRYRVWRGPGSPVAGTGVNGPAGDRAPGGEVTLRLTPLLTCRTIHGVLHRNDWPFTQTQPGTASVALVPYRGAPHIAMAMDGGQYTAGGEWVLGLYYPYEELRGEHTQEDLYCPGHFSWTCPGHGELTFVASAEPIAAIEGDAWEKAEQDRRIHLVQTAQADDSFSRNLVLAADQFVVHRASTHSATIVAGYPWFTDWGRDTMISLHGLALCTRRYHLARELLHTFAHYERDGLIPNCFPEEGEQPLYNTADASLWFFEATWHYLQQTGDDPFVQTELLPVLTRIVEAHMAGTHFDIRQTPDGLLRCGNPEIQVTWMDAKVGDWVVTPRDGRPVEIQALWYNALRILAALSARYGQESMARRWEAAAEKAAAGFQKFWNPAEGCCYDRLDDDNRPDPAIRPNQVFTMTLTYPLLHGERARQTVHVLFRDLWTPYGLRSLSPHEPAYKGVYVGSRSARDAAYHQGTVWAWLAGPFLRAYLHAYGRSPATVAHVRLLLEPLRGHLQEYGLATVAENFDGDPPFRPRACVAQAWSVAELLRVWLEL